MHSLKSKRCIAFAVCDGADTSGVLVAGTSLRLLAEELLRTAGRWCPSRYRYVTVLMDLCLMVWYWRVLRAEPTLSCLINLLFHFVSSIFSFPSLHGLVVWGWGLRIDRGFSLSPSVGLWTI